MGQLGLSSFVESLSQVQSTSSIFRVVFDFDMKFWTETARLSSISACRTDCFKVQGPRTPRSLFFNNFFKTSKMCREMSNDEIWNFRNLLKKIFRVCKSGRCSSSLSVETSVKLVHRLSGSSMSSEGKTSTQPRTFTCFSVWIDDICTSESCWWHFRAFVVCCFV